VTGSGEHRDAQSRRLRCRLRAVAPDASASLRSIRPAVSPCSTIDPITVTGSRAQAQPPAPPPVRARTCNGGMTRRAGRRSPSATRSTRRSPPARNHARRAILVTAVAAGKIGERAGRVSNDYKVAKHFDRPIVNGFFSYQRNTSPARPRSTGSGWCAPRAPSIGSPPRRSCASTSS
jgi:hypothetical protein